MAQVFNKDTVLKVVDNDTDLLIEILQLFLSEKDKMLSNIHKAISDNNRNDLKIAAHTLKGTLNNVGAEEAALQAYLLEQFDMSQEIALAEPMAKMLEQQITEYESAIADLIR